MNHTKKEPRSGYVGLGQARLSQVSLGQVKTVLSFAWFLFYDSFLVVPFCVIICWCDSFFAVPFLFSSLVVHFCQGSFFAFFFNGSFLVVPLWRDSFQATFLLVVPIWCVSILPGSFLCNYFFAVTFFGFLLSQKDASMLVEKS